MGKKKVLSSKYLYEKLYESQTSEDNFSFLIYKSHINITAHIRMRAQTSDTIHCTYIHPVWTNSITAKSE